MLPTTQAAPPMSARMASIFDEGFKLMPPLSNVTPFPATKGFPMNVSVYSLSGVLTNERYGRLLFTASPVKYLEELGWLGSASGDAEERSHSLLLRPFSVMHAHLHSLGAQSVCRFLMCHQV
jgi:hypothetical protein